jgi:peptide/nickel transport system substrate-binding protein
MPTDDELRRFDQLIDFWSRRDFIRGLGAAVAFTAFMGGGLELLEACGGNQPNSATTSSTPRKGGHVVYGQSYDITNVNSAIAPGLTGNIVVNHMVFDSLVFYNLDGTIVPSLSQLPSVSSDGTTYVFKLNPGARFSDGSPITADDAKFTYDLMFDPAYKDVPSPRRSELETYVQSITAVDAQTLVIKLKQLWAPFLTSHGINGIMPKKAFAGMNGKQIATADFNTNPTIVSGQYRWVKWDKGQQLSLARNDAYWGQKSYLDTYIQRVIPDTTQLSNALKTGEVDVAAVSASLVESFKGVSNVVIDTYPIPSIYFYAYNLNPEKPQSQFFLDRRVRQALVYAINRQQMANAVFFGYASVAKSWVSPTSWAYNPDARPVYNYDPKMAGQLLDAAGWKTNSSTGIREKGGVPFKIQMDVRSDSQESVSMAQIIQEEWKAVGVDVALKTEEKATLVRNFQFNHDHYISMNSVNFVVSEPDESILFASRNTVPGGLNGADYKNPELDTLLNEGVSTLDQKKRKDIYVKVQNILQEDQPYVELLVPKGIIGYQSRVHGGEFGPPSRPINRNMWVDDGK